MLLLRTFWRYLGKSMFTKVSPGKGEKTYLDLPMFNEVEDVVKAIGSDTTVLYVPLSNSERLNLTIIYDRDFNYSCFGCKPLERLYLLKISDHTVKRPQHMLMRVAVGIHSGDIDPRYCRFYHKDDYRVLYERERERYEQERERNAKLENEWGIHETQLKQVTSKLIERDGLVVLRSHVEITEGLFLASHPIPSSVAEYKRLLELRKTELNEDIVQAIKGELKAEIVWPKSIDIEIKDAMDKKINKHFRIWIWLLYMVDALEIIALRNDVGNTLEGIRRLASGIAGLYIYSSFMIRSRVDYSKEELQKYTLPKLYHPLIRPAAELVLKNLWL